MLPVSLASGLGIAPPGTLQNPELEPASQTMIRMKPIELDPIVTVDDAGTGAWHDEKSSGHPCLLSAAVVSQALKAGTIDVLSGDAPMGNT